MVSSKDRGHSDGMNGAVAAVLRGERAAQGMTIDQLAARSGIPNVTVQRLLATRRAITIDVLTALCDALDTTPAEVMVTASTRYHRADPELVERVLQGVRSAGTRVGDSPVTPAT